MLARLSNQRFEGVEFDRFSDVWLAQGIPRRGRNLGPFDEAQELEQQSQARTARLQGCNNQIVSDLSRKCQSKSLSAGAYVGIRQVGRIDLVPDLGDELIQRGINLLKITRCFDRCGKY